MQFSFAPTAIAIDQIRVNTENQLEYLQRQLFEVEIAIESRDTRFENEIKIGDLYQGDDFVCKVIETKYCKIRKETKISLQAVDCLDVIFSVWSGDMNQFSKVTEGGAK